MRMNGLHYYYTDIRLEGQLSEWERKYSLQRWLPSDTVYKELEYSLVLDKKEQLLLELWKISQRRLFLLKLKKKYAGDHVVG